MERRVYEAAVEGSVESLLKLLQEDALLLDRSMVSCYSETPLHIASMLGHENFVLEILSRKPELAGELDSRRSSALHLASAKGYLVIVKKLVSVNPEMCYVRDRDGKNPLHVAAIKGHDKVLEELFQKRPEACRVLMDRGETILHACVNYNQLECLKLLVEKLNDHEFVNSKDDDGNTILHLAVIDKQVEAVKFLTGSTTIEVNAVNANGFTALDILAQRKLDMNSTIGELLRCAGARSLKETREPASGTTKTRTGSIITSHSGDPSNQGRERPEKARKKQEDKWSEKKRNTLMVVASLIATMAFQAGLNPPGGVWQDDSPKNDASRHQAGCSVMLTQDEISYNLFFGFNTTGFVASLSIILLFISGIPFFKRRFFMWILTVIMWVAISAMALAYLIAILGITNSGNSMIPWYASTYVLLGWIGFIGILILAHIVRLIVKMIKYFRKLMRDHHGEPQVRMLR
ncbi:ANK REP REGION domain-containing protein [Citrus sinensis]|uniref:ANK REP REGION domain-containing protein n=1 Tax=Citrus sinensis TaxID=2711 RepID=A0ACB8P6B9_CITSI|nr:ANK REP REGION domain-containing protein [Citrus sinensis]